MNSVRDIKVTESYLGLDQSVKACKDEEEPHEVVVLTLAPHRPTPATNVRNFGLQTQTHTAWADRCEGSHQ